MATEIDCNGLRHLRDAEGPPAVAAKLAEHNLVIPMSKKDMKRQLYASQSFLDQEKLARARMLPRERFEAPCSYWVDSLGNARFVLRDGHHRALLNYIDCVGIIVVLSAEGTKSQMDFRSYYRHHCMNVNL